MCFDMLPETKGLQSVTLLFMIHLLWLSHSSVCFFFLIAKILFKIYEGKRFSLGLYLFLFFPVLCCFSFLLHLQYTYIQYICASQVQPSLLCRSSFNLCLWLLLSCLCVLLYVPVFTWFQILRYFYNECYMAFCSSHTTVMDSFFFLSVFSAGV